MNPKKCARKDEQSKPAMFPKTIELFRTLVRILPPANSSNPIILLGSYLFYAITSPYAIFGSLYTPLTCSLQKTSTDPLYDSTCEPQKTEDWSISIFSKTEEPTIQRLKDTYIEWAHTRSTKSRHETACSTIPILRVSLRPIFCWNLPAYREDMKRKTEYDLSSKGFKIEEGQLTQTLEHRVFKGHLFLTSALERMVRVIRREPLSSHSGYTTSPGSELS